MFIMQKAEGTYFEELDEEGFLINGNYYKGGVLAFNDIALLWDVKSLEELTPESLKTVTVYNPTIGTLFSYYSCDFIDTLIIGTGKYTAPIPENIVEYMHKFGISIESMSSVTILYCIY